MGDKELSISGLRLRWKAIEWGRFWKPRREEDAAIRTVLESTPLFEGLSHRDWRMLADLFHLRRYSPGEIIFEEGTPGLGMYVILSGEVCITSQADGREVILATLGPGDFFGELSLIDEIERSANARAEGKTELIGLFRPHLRELMMHRPKLGVRMYERLAKVIVRRMREANRLLIEQQIEMAKARESE